MKMRSSGVRFMIKAMKEGRNMAMARQTRIISSLSILQFIDHIKKNATWRVLDYFDRCERELGRAD